MAVKFALITAGLVEQAEHHFGGKGREHRALDAPENIETNCS